MEFESLGNGNTYVRIICSILYYRSIWRCNLMNNRRTTWIYVLLIVLILITCLSLFSTLSFEIKNSFISSFFDYWNNGYGKIVVIVVFIIAIIFIILHSYVSLLFRFREIKHGRSDIDNLEKLLEYSQKRREIEQEISRLTSELSHSDVSEYLNINHLVFSGQAGIIGNGAINYDQFLSQFGIDKDAIQTRIGYSVFLTPFNSASAKLFETCSSILNRMGILLQRTDNIVDKNDIMMNIISQIVRAEFLIVNIDGRNPNVYYELGIAHAIGKPTILISKTDFSDDSIGFDIRQKQIILYKNHADLEKGLLYQINRIRNKQVN